MYATVFRSVLESETGTRSRVPVSGTTLLATARTSDADAVVPTTDGGPEPLHAVYRVGPTRAAARATIDDGRRSLHAMVAALSVETVPVGTGVPARSVTSVDTAKQWRELTAADED